MVYMLCNPNTQEAKAKNISLLCGETMPQKTKGQGYSSVVQHLPSMYEAFFKDKILIAQLMSDASGALSTHTQALQIYKRVN